MIASRKEARQALAQLLSAGVPSAQRIYRYQVKKLNGESPVLAITGAGSEREKLAFANSRALFLLDIHSFVFYGDGKLWTEEQAEDTLDDLEREIYATIEANNRTTDWSAIAYAERTDARQPVTIEGSTYLHEVIPVAIAIF